MKFRWMLVAFLIFSGFNPKSVFAFDRASTLVKECLNPSVEKSNEMIVHKKSIAAPSSPTGVAPSQGKSGKFINSGFVYDPKGTGPAENRILKFEKKPQPQEWTPYRSNYDANNGPSGRIVDFASPIIDKKTAESIYSRLLKSGVQQRDLTKDRTKDGSGYRVWVSAKSPIGLRDGSAMSGNDSKLVNEFNHWMNSQVPDLKSKYYQNITQDLDKDDFDRFKWSSYRTRNSKTGEFTGPIEKFASPIVHAAGVAKFYYDQAINSGISEKYLELGKTGDGLWYRVWISSDYFKRGASLEIEPINLENKFNGHAFPDSVNVVGKAVFGDYISPNEWYPKNVKAHLNHIEKPGVLVSAGTERSFFDLALCEKCTGLVVRDIEPRAKAYVDFNVMLLRLAEDVNDYARLSFAPKGEDKINKHRAEVKKRLESCKAIPAEAKNYYLKNFEGFSKLYYEYNNARLLESANGSWRGDLFRGSRGRDENGDRIVEETKNAFDGVKYFEDKNLFKRLQKLAREGKIIATLGDIGDLQFLDNVNIAAVDTSNIPDYAFLDIDVKEGNFPRVIWVDEQNLRTKFHSYSHQPLTECERAEFKKLFYSLNIVLSEWSWIQQKAISSDKFNCVPPCSYSPYVFKLLKNYKPKN